MSPGGFSFFRYGGRRSASNELIRHACGSDAGRSPAQPEQAAGKQQCGREPSTRQRRLDPGGISQETFLLVRMLLTTNLYVILSV